MSFINKLKKKSKKLKNEIVAISLAFNDKRTPIFAKIIIGLTISYTLSPIDLIPDFIPIIGYLDDLIILPFMIILSIKLIPSEVMIDCRMQSQHESRLNKKIGLLSAMLIVLLWVGLIGLLVFRIF